jgi:hypothetical protein
MGKDESNHFCIISLIEDQHPLPCHYYRWLQSPTTHNYSIVCQRKAVSKTTGIGQARL